MKEKTIKVGIGFATGRKQFKRVLRSYFYNWKESGLIENEQVSLNLFVAYDLSYRNTQRSDYTPIGADIEELIEAKQFIGKQEVEETREQLVGEGVLTEKEASVIFGKGYACQRNIVLYAAIQNRMDYLLFLDDDEYPVAVTKTSDIAIWSGQQVLKKHLQNIKNCDISYGYHCGYISPIPFVQFSDMLSESVFRTFIEAISNDIVNWENLKKTMNAGGVTYADTSVLMSHDGFEVQEVNHAKFISGSNLCINLTDPNRVFPFYNPPGARGEDTFLSTCLSERKVLRIPVYAFHDGFSTYNHLLSGVLPTKLDFIRPDSEQIVNRFYQACIGWVRYKPLLLYITKRDSYEEEIRQMRENLQQTLPAICEYFGTKAFLKILNELDTYSNKVEEHFNEFERIQNIWSKVMHSLRSMGDMPGEVEYVGGRKDAQKRQRGPGDHRVAADT